MSNDKDGKLDEDKKKEYEKNVIKSLDLDFLNYLKQLEVCMQQECLESDKDLIEAWCDKLLSEKRMSIINKRRRNIFLTQLILAIKENRVSFSPVFSKPPLPLSSYPTSVFGFTAPTKNVERRNKSSDLSEHVEVSPSKRTYIATQALPDGAGFMAYVGLSLGSTPDWFDSQGKPFFKEVENSVGKTCPSQNNACKKNVKTNPVPIINSQVCEEPDYSGDGNRKIVEGTHVHDILLKKINKSIKHIEETQSIPLDEDDNVLCIMNQIQKKTAARKCDKFSRMQATQRYYEMLKLIRKCILSKYQPVK